jgi:hypothetical protein
VGTPRVRAEDDRDSLDLSVLETFDWKVSDSINRTRAGKVLRDSCAERAQRRVSAKDHADGPQMETDPRSERR